MKRRERVVGWSLTGVGVSLFLAAVLGIIVDGEALLIDFVERFLPVLVACGLVAFNAWLRHNGATGRDVAFVTLGSVAAATLFVLFEVWTLFLVGLEAPVPEETDYIFLNSAALGSFVGALLMYQYRRLQHERNRLASLTDDLNRTNDQLQDKLDRLDEFARVVSHDLRNPLSVADGYLTLARDTGRDEHFETASRALDRAEAITTDMLRLAREGKAVDDLEPVALDEVAAQAWSTVDTGDVSLETTTGVTIEADENRLRQLFENLFRNAIVHGGGALTTVRIDTLGSNGFAVEDDGVGIESVVAERLFELGYSTGPDGTGYGLAIVKAIVDGHGWDVEATVGDAGGARFAFTGVEVVDSVEHRPLKPLIE